MKRQDTDTGGKHRWTPGTPWVATVAGEIEHARPGTEAPANLGFRRDHEPQHTRPETGGAR